MVDSKDVRTAASQHVSFIYVCAQKEKFPSARFELHQLLSQPSLQGVPLLVLGNKNDLEGHAEVNEVIKAL